MPNAALRQPHHPSIAPELLRLRREVAEQRDTIRRLRLQVARSERRAIIEQGYQVGLPVSEIAAMIGSTPGSVRVIAHKMGIKHPGPLPRQLPPGRVDDYRFLTRQKRIPAAEAKQILGAAK